MANDRIYIDDRELRKLNMNFNQFARELNGVCKEALKNLGQRIIAEAQRTLWRKRNVATGLLVNSGAVKEGADNSILAGFPTIYAYYVEFGRRAGKWPPFRFIYEWVRVRHLAYDDEEARQKAFLIQRSIGNKGTKPHPFLKPAFEKNKRLYEQVIRKGAAKIINKDYTNV
jgi:HK97 gp10 family phage protein